MSKKSNVHPDYYKTAGRDPQGQAVLQEVERQKFREQEVFLEKQARRRNLVPAANRVPTPGQNLSRDTTSGQEVIREGDPVNDQPPKAKAEKEPTPGVVGKPKASAEKKPARRVVGKPKASAEKKPARRVVGKPKASAEKKPARRVVGKPKASAEKKPARRVVGKKRAPAPRTAQPMSKSPQKASKRP